MTGFWVATGFWVVEIACGGGLILLLAWVASKLWRQPVRRQRLGEWGMAAALLLTALSLGPRWLILPVPRALTSCLPELATAAPFKTDSLCAAAVDEHLSNADLPRAPATDLSAAESYVALYGETAPLPDEQFVELAEHRRTFEGDRTVHPGASTVASRVLPTLAQPASPEHAPMQPSAPQHALIQSAFPERQTHAVEKPLALLGIAYVFVGGLLLGRWLLAHLGLRRLLLSARPAPLQAHRLLREICRGSSIQPRLLVCSRLRVPLSCGLWRPTILLPAELLEAEARSTWPWILRHELTHLERRDAWACLWFGLGQVFYFYLPWFWWLRRQVRLCQEYVADAAAAGCAAAVEDYAEFLLRFTGVPAVPAGATGVFGNSSDLFRRVTMLLQSPLKVEGRCPRKWSLAAACLLGGLAVLVSSVGLRAEVAPAPADPVKPPAPANPLDKKDQPAQAGPAADPAAAFAERVQQQQQMMQQMMRGNQGMMGPFGFNRHEGRLGVQVQPPSETLVDQLDLPKGQGIVVLSVVKDSAAEKAGIKTHDILLELDGKTVPSDALKLVHMIEDMKADTAMNAVVLRKGKKETIKGISLPELKVARRLFPQAPNFNQGFPAPPLAAPNFGQRFGGAGNFGGGLGFGAAGPRSVLTTTIREDDHFTTRHEEGSLIITLTGTVADGKAKVSKIQVQDGSIAHSYESTDKVPEEYRDKVKNLVQMSQRSNIKIEIQTPPEAKPNQPAPAK